MFVGVLDHSASNRPTFDIIETDTYLAERLIYVTGDSRYATFSGRALDEAAERFGLKRRAL